MRQIDSLVLGGMDKFSQSIPSSGAAAGVGPTPTYATYVGAKRGVNLKSLMVEGDREVNWPSGGIAPIRHETVWLYASTPIGGFGAGSPQACAYILKQLQEMAENAEAQPYYTQFGDAPSLDDGWYFLETVEPDSEFMPWSGIVQVKIALREHMLGAPRTSFWYAGGNRPTTYTNSVPAALTAYPPNSSLALSGTRPGAEGSSLFQLRPTANPVPYELSTTVADWFNMRCHLYDTLTPNTTSVPVDGSAYPASWVEIRSPDHNLQGDLVMTNGLLLAVMGKPTSWTGVGSYSIADLYIWDPIAANYLGTDTDGTINAFTSYGGALGNWSIAANILTCTAGGGAKRLLTNKSYGANISWTVRMVGNGIAGGGSNPGAGILVRFDGANYNGYGVRGGPFGGLQLFRATAGAETVLTADSSISTVNKWIRLTANGSTLIVYTAPDVAGAPGAWTQVLSATDTTYPSGGSVGFITGTFDAGGGFGGAYPAVASVTPWTGAWNGFARLIYKGTTATSLRQIRPVIVSPDEVAVKAIARIFPSGTLAEVTMSLWGGSYFFNTLFSPQNYDSTDFNSLVLLPFSAYDGTNHSAPIFASTAASGDASTGVADAPTTPGALDDGWAARLAIKPTSDANPRDVIWGFLTENQQAYTGSWGDYVVASGGSIPAGTYESALQLGDTSGPLSGQTRRYGVFALPYSDYRSLQAEAETLGAPWASTADAGASAGNAAKLTSGAAAGSPIQFGTSWTPAKGDYICFFRLRASALVGSGDQVQVGVMKNGVSGAAILALSPSGGSGNVWTTTYKTWKTGRFTLDGATTVRFFAQVLATTSDDLYIDEAWLVPVTKFDSPNTYPEDLWNQFMYDRSAKSPVLV